MSVITDRLERPETQEMLRLFEYEYEGMRDPLAPDSEPSTYWKKLMDKHGEGFATEVWYDAYHIWKGDSDNV